MASRKASGHIVKTGRRMYVLMTRWTSAGLLSSRSCCCSVMVWTEIKLPFNPPPLHMTSLWCTSHRELSLVHRVFSCVTCSQSELLSSASTPTGQPVVEWVRRRGARERGKCFYEWKHGGEDACDEQTQILRDRDPHLLVSISFQSIFTSSLIALSIIYISAPLLSRFVYQNQWTLNVHLNICIVCLKTKTTSYIQVP